MNAVVADRHAYTAGLVTVVVGFSSSFAVVLTGLRQMGATPVQAASGLAALCLTVGVATILLAWRYRIPVTAAWSTPGAALLAASPAPAGGWPTAVGAFVVTGLLIVATAAVPALGTLTARIPTSIAQAMLAGVLVPLCLKPVLATAASPSLMWPVLLAWVVVLLLAPRWATPAAIAAALAVTLVHLSSPPVATVGFALVVPHLSLQAVIGISVPLWLVTMASQNVPGVAVLKTFGYETPWRPSLLTTGIGTTMGAFAGGHAICLSAISAALAAGHDAGPDTSRRWRAAVTAGGLYLVLTVGAGALAAVVLAAPGALLPAAAGLALIGTLAGSIQQALADAAGRLPAAVTFLVAASGVTVLGIGGAFWALLVGVLLRLILVRHSRGA
ncbi:MAG TPA: benzoate/H(+) symporter BenE family transporter [Candidatus Limnocylindrales bacterium]